MKNFNLLYCFDEGYNLQTYASIYSIAKNLRESKIDIYIIHKNPDTFTSYKEKIKNFDKVNEVFIFPFEKDISNYPNLKNRHVSEATYYRLFLSEYIPKNLDHIIYLDSDVFCIKDPEHIMSYSVENLLKSEFTISAATEVYKTKENYSSFSRLDLENERYFNAGVMIIDYQKWIKSIEVDELLSTLRKSQHLLDNWDQDLLNIIFDGNYMELTNFLNYRIYFQIPNYFLDNYPIFIHFAGNHKPWTLEGSYDNVADIYFSLLDELKVKTYNIKLKSRKAKSLSILLRNILMFKIFTRRKATKLFIENLKALLSG